MKTVKDSFKELPNLIAVKAIRNTSKEILSSQSSGLLQDLSCGFVWKTSPEGLDYWQNIKNTIIKIDP